MMTTLASIGAWFYRGSRSIPTAHWIYHEDETPICRKLRTREDGFVWRHPTHDRHIPKCKFCLEIISAAEAEAARLTTLAGRTSPV